MPTPSPTPDRPALPPEVPFLAVPTGCLDLRVVAGERWRVFPSEDQLPGHRLDPWNLELRGPKGKVWPYGGYVLVAYTDKPRIRTKLMAMGVVQQMGDEEVTVQFRPKDLDDVADLLGLYRKRTMSPEARAIAAERLRRVRPS